MKKILFCFGLLIALTSHVQAQKKSELITRNTMLRMELDSVKALVRSAQKNEEMSNTRAASFEVQVQELQTANATLLKNLNSFAAVSNTNSENINRAMASLGAKEKQLKAINDAIAKNDSTAIIVLTNAKQTLGENARIGVVDGAVLIAESLETLFGGSSSVALTAEGEAYVGQIATILKANPTMGLTLEGLSMTGELSQAAAQAITISTLLQQQYTIDPNRISVLSKDGNFKEGINFNIHPKFNRFYSMVRDNMKRTN